MTVTTDAWLNRALAYVGIVESPLGSNRTPVGERYGLNGVPWCCETQSLITLDAFGDWILHTAGVADAMARAKRGENGMEWISRDAEIRVSDLPCYGWDGPHTTNWNNMHIGGVVNPGTQAKFEAVEGNLHDRCQRVWRDRTYVMGFIRLPVDEVGLAEPPATPTTRRQDKVYILVKGDQKPEWWLSDHIKATHIIDQAHADQEINEIRISGGVVVTQPGNQPVIKRQAEVDQLRGQAVS